MNLKNKSFVELIQGFSYSFGAIAAVVVLISILLVAAKVVTLVFNFLF